MSRIDGRVLMWALVVLGATGLAQAGELRLSGSASIEVRTFAEPAGYAGQLTGGQSSAVLQPTLEWRSEDGRSQVRILGFWRRDDADPERTHSDLREAYFRRVAERWEVLVGVNRVFWGVAEARHLVDVVNQVDALESIDGEDRLGQPMVELSTQRSWGRLSVLALLGFRERSLPGESGRLRLPLELSETAVYESAAGQDRVDWAVRWSHAVGDWDLGLHAFHGTGREPRLAPDATGELLVARYDVVSQAGLDVQLTRGAWLGKLELLGRSGHGATFGAGVAGVERTLYQVFGTAADLGLLTEVLWDGRDATAPSTAFEHDLFLGARLALNDFQDTSVLAGVVLDERDGSRVFRLEAERRLGSTFSLELEAQWFSGTHASPALRAFEHDDFYSVTVTRHF